MINPNILKNLVKPYRVFVNTITGAKFMIEKIENGIITFKVSAKLKRGHSPTPVEYNLSYDTFVASLEWDGLKEPTFVVLEKK